MAQIAERNVWAVQLLDVRPSDRLLEIGCGRGHAVSLIGDLLTDGTVTAIDRSETMIAAAEKVNAHHVSAGKASFLCGTIADLDRRTGLYHKVFAVNVNLFWMEASEELNAIRDVLLPDGTVYIMNQPPTEGKLPHIAARTRQQLIAGGFEIVRESVGDLRPIPGVCVVGRRL